MSEVALCLDDEPKRPAVRKGLFVLDFSYFEVMLADLLRVYLSGHPRKLPVRKVEFRVADALSPRFLENQVSEAVSTMMRGSMKGILVTVGQTLAIDLPTDGDLVDRLVEIKATRNCLLHNGLAVDQHYLETAGRLKRSERLDSVLPVDNSYVSASHHHMNCAVSLIEGLLRSMYGSLTRTSVIRQL